MLERPLLAAKTTDADLKRLKFPVLVSPKIDGIRACVVNGRLMSRSMKPIPNEYTQAMFGRPELEGMDGELVVGNPWDKNLMQQTTSGVMSKKGIPNISYHVFDHWDFKGPFKARIDVAHTIAAYHAKLPIVSVQHATVYDYERLMSLEAEFVTMGYEGLMIRDPYGLYKQGRSTIREGILLKVKRFVDAEATVIGYEPLMRNLNPAFADERGYTKRSSHQDNKVADSLLGTLLVQDMQSGVCFSVGSGFTEQQRKDLWQQRNTLAGRIVKYKSLSIGVKDKPRLPIFLGFRSPLDL